MKLLALLFLFSSLSFADEKSRAADEAEKVAAARLKEAREKLPHPTQEREAEVLKFLERKLHVGLCARHDRKCEGLSSIDKKAVEFFKTILAQEKSRETEFSTQVKDWKTNLGDDRVRDFQISQAQTYQQRLQEMNELLCKESESKDLTYCHVSSPLESNICQIRRVHQLYNKVKSKEVSGLEEKIKTSHAQDWDKEKDCSKILKQDEVSFKDADPLEDAPVLVAKRADPPSVKPDPIIPPLKAASSPDVLLTPIPQIKPIQPVPRVPDAAASVSQRDNKLKLEVPAIQKKSPPIQLPGTPADEGAGALSETQPEENQDEKSPRNYRPETCVWAKDLPRRVVHGPGCGKDMTRICTGHVICERKEGEGKFVRMSTCGPEHCGGSQKDAINCTKQGGYFSVKAKDESKEFVSPDVKKIIKKGIRQ